MAWNGKKTGHANDDGSQHLIPDVEVVVCEAAPLVRQDAVVGVLRGILRHGDAEGPPLFHALEDEVDAIEPALVHAAERRQHLVLFAQALFRPLHRDFVIAGVGLNPVAVIVGALTERFLAHHRGAEHLMNEINHLFRPGQPAEIPVDDDAVEAVVYKNQQAGKQLCEKFHRSPTLRSCLDNSIIGQATGGIKISNIFG